MTDDENFLFKQLKYVLGGKNPSNASEQVKQQLGALGFKPVCRSSNIKDYYDIDVYFKNEGCGFYCEYKKWWFITSWTVRMLDDSL